MLLLGVGMYLTSRAQKLLKEHFSGVGNGDNQLLPHGQLISFLLAIVLWQQWPRCRAAILLQQGLGQ